MRSLWLVLIMLAQVPALAADCPLSGPERIACR